MENRLGSIKLRGKGKPIATLVFLTVLTMIGLQLTGQNLISSEAPSGIVSYELARNEIASQAILDSWDQTAKTYAAFNLGLDYLFLILYPATIAVVVLWLVELLALGSLPVKLANIIALSMVITGVLDAIENSALLFMLVNSAESPFPQVAYVSAIVKFLLVGIGLLAIVVLLVKLIIRRLR